MPIKVVALNTPQLQAYGGYVNGKPASCYQSITISAFGQQQQATIMDGMYTSLAIPPTDQVYSVSVL
jgi:hypothetical protein